MINMNMIEKLLEILGKIAYIVAVTAGLIWLYKEGTLFKNIFVTVFGGFLIFLPFFLLNKTSHQALCKSLGVKFPYIVYLIPIIIFGILFGSGLAKGAYYGCNPNNPICKQQIEQRKLSQ